MSFVFGAFKCCLLLIFVTESVVYGDEVVGTDHCDPNPCQHGGSCVVTGVTFECACVKPYSGRRCEDHCAPNPCQHGGSCIVTGGTFECACVKPYAGRRCENPDPSIGKTPSDINVDGDINKGINHCNPNPCENGGSCLDIGITFECGCVNKFTGRRCENQENTPSDRGVDGDINKGINHCNPNPCRNGGSCLDIGITFECGCVNKFAGRRCEIIIDLCGQNPCQNGGSCVETGDTFECACVEPYAGRLCMENQAPCSPNPCHNGGQCVSPDGASYRCFCPERYTGNKCENSIEASCADVNCQHYGICVSGSCFCPPVYTGTFCETPVLDACDKVTCLNDGTCVEGTCNCADGWTGNNCADADLCHSTTCQHGGTCLAGFCTCSDGWTGTTCSDPVLDACDKVTCLNDGTCVEGTCNCAEGWTGNNCADADLCHSTTCQHGGTCLAGFCTCADGWTGTTCSDKMPFACLKCTGEISLEECFFTICPTSQKFCWVSRVVEGGNTVGYHAGCTDSCSSNVYEKCCSVYACNETL